MEVIKPLSEDVHSMVRSSFIISCLTTVVEELIYNSLDAGATKVSVSVAVNNGYVKVEDDGCGISRSGLVLLGERYATSKVRHFHENDNFVGSFGFRGEALCSIADISLVEIVTRVQGRPNGYRKIMKGRKCLCLSIDNDRQAVGTTVIVRDLFYNQPVRRRQMQCSAKKVLHSVKKSAVRIALVQPKVFFKVIDMESEDELLSTHSCPSPLTLLCSNFGIEASGLHELSFSEGPLRLTGYVSALSSSFSSKAIQYIYVNSRFVDKSPIHKVLNRLADMCHDQLRGDRGVKKSQPLAPSYCLNLTCPRYSYNLNLEFSRVSVEFKDWASVLAFVEKSVMSLWSEEVKRGIFHNHEADQIRKDGKENVVEKTFSVEREMWLKSCEMSTKRRRTQKSENQHMCTKEALDLQVEDCKNFSLRKNISSQCMNPENFTVNFRDIETERESLHQVGITGASDASLSDCIFDVEDGIDSHLLEPETGRVNGDLLGNGFTSMKTKANYANDYFCSSSRKEEVSMDYLYAGCHEEGSVWSFDFTLKGDSNKVTDDRELFLQSSSWENPLETPLDYGKESQFQIHNFNAKSNFHGNGDADRLSQNFDIYQRAQYESELENSWPLPKSGIGSHTKKDVDVDHLERDKSLPSCGGFFDRESPLESSGNQGRVLSPCSPKNCGQQTAITYPILKLKDWDIENFIEDEGFGRRLGVRNYDDIAQFNYDREEFCQDGLDDRCSSQNIFSPNRLNSRTLLASEYHHNVEKGMWECSPHGHNVDGTAFITSESFQDIYSPCRDRRHKDSSFSLSPSISPNRGIEMDLLVGQELGPENIARESSWRTYDSPDGFCTDRCDSIVTSETFSPYLDFQSKLSSFKPSVGCSSAISAGKGPKLDLPRSQVFEPNHSSSNSGCSLRSRSHSAPPFYRAKKKFLSVKSSLTSTTENSALQTASQACTVSERTQSKHPANLTFSRSVNQQGDEIRFGEDSLFCLEQKVKETSNIAPVSPWSHSGNTDAASLSSGYLTEVQDSESWQTKWREGCLDASSKEMAKSLTAGDRLNDLKDENAILDIQSCMLDLAGDSLVPKSINRNGLQNAKVLWQIDNKYIPVVAGGTLAVIDQHAADERIRLEEMRQKVLSGEMKSINYLEKEKDLVLPEMAYQLLCNYAEHIKHWGWICNIFCQDSGSFAKNLNFLNERASSLTLMAVPCILGVNLSDADLVEFLEQLADTDGSSTIPPSVVRVLNYKACRGAIMFGDKLLPSECSLIVEELKQTSLCFQCAHGRPTTVPLVNLKALHKGILHLGSWHGSSKNTWHGLCRKQITLDRAKCRLNVTRGCC